MISIAGFTALQRELADRLWAMDTEQEVTEFVAQLPRSLKREAWVVLMMILAEELDQVQEVDPRVADLIQNLS